MKDDAFWMGVALEQAEKAFQAGEVPVGAAVVSGGELIAAAYTPPTMGTMPGAAATATTTRT